jgi:hypothetical protein
MYDKIDGNSSLSIIYYFNDYFFSYFSYFISLTGIDYRGYLFITFFFCVSILLLAYKNIIVIGTYKNLQSSNEAFFFYIVACIFLFCSSTFYLFSLNAIRQFMAISLFMFGLSLYLSNKPKQSYLFYILAAMSHSSALLLIFAFFTSKLFRLRIIIVSALVLTPLFFFIGPIYLSNFISNTLGFDFIGDKILNLSGSSTGSISVEVKYIHALFFSFLALFIALKTNNIFFRKIVLFYVTYVLISGLMLSSPIMATRLLLYSGIIEPIILAFSLCLFKPKQRLFLACLFAILSIFYMSYLYFFNSTIRSQVVWQECHGCYLNSDYYEGN